MTHTAVVFPDGSGRVRAIQVEHSTGDAPQTPDEQLILQLQAENEALRASVKKANDQAEHFEREWYLRGDEIEALRKRGKFSIGDQVRKIMALADEYAAKRTMKLHSSNEAHQKAAVADLDAARTALLAALAARPVDP